MWVRFWHQCTCSSSLCNPESRYDWFDSDPGDDCLEDTAHEIVPSWCTDSERGYKYGFERVDRPPQEELQKLLSEWTNRVQRDSRMIRILTEELAK